MTILIKSIETFLRESLGFHSSSVQLYLFGSVARKSNKPSDVDIIVSYSEENEGAAIHARRILRDSNKSFEICFGVPLNLLVLSQTELEEARGKISDLIRLKL